jgi:hypothetical protein
MVEGALDSHQQLQPGLASRQGGLLWLHADVIVQVFLGCVAQVVEWQHVTLGQTMVAHHWTLVMRAIAE